MALGGCLLPVISIRTRPQRERDHHEVIHDTVSRIVDFDEDNRAGIERTLHRYSAIRKKKGDVMDSPCAWVGCVRHDRIIEDLLNHKKNPALGKPGIGKTTHAARSCQIRVKIPAWSSWILPMKTVATESPHPGSWKSLTQAVCNPSRQQEVMSRGSRKPQPRSDRN
jgi:hypothetical protein